MNKPDGPDVNEGLPQGLYVGFRSCHVVIT